MGKYWLKMAPYIKYLFVPDYRLLEETQCVLISAKFLTGISASLIAYISLEPMQKFEFLRQPLLGELAMSWRERRKKENSASADGGPRSRVCARETLRSAPHRH